MSLPMRQHPSATVRTGTTLVPETVGVVSAFLSRTPMPQGDVHKLVKEVHAALVGIALESGTVSEDLHRIGYHPHAAGMAAPVDVASVAARLFSGARPQQRAVPVPLPAPSPRPAEEKRALPLAEVLPMHAAPVAPAPLPEVRSDVVVPFRRPERKPKPEMASEQIELPIMPAAPVPPKGVTVRSSVQMEWLVCLEDGKKTRNLTKHISDRYGMTPDEYRAKWGLPASYPMHPPAAILNHGDQFEFEPLSGAFRRLRGK